MKEIPLTQGQVAIVDDEDYEWLSAFSWHAKFNPGTKTYYAERSVYTPTGVRTFGMHRDIIGATLGTEVDHLDRDALNNRRYNLRTCTTSQNQANRGAPVNNTSGFKGVTWNKSSQKWQAQIETMDRKLYLGVFASKETAARAYDVKATELFGEFAYINFEVR